MSPMDCVYLMCGVTCMLPHLSWVPYFHVNRPLISTDYVDVTFPIRSQNQQYYLCEAGKSVSARMFFFFLR